MKANPGVKETRLQIGQKLEVPVAATKATTRTAQSVAKAPAKPAGTATHVVRNGENDWTLAKRYGITQAQLHAMNPGVKWKNLQIGTQIKVPGKAGGASPTLASNPASAPASGGSYRVQQGDNDWIIARKLGITVAALHQLNPKVTWSRLQIGQALNAPKTNQTAPVRQANSITTKRAKIVRDDVNVRSKASTSGRLVMQVKKGTIGDILDSESGWLKLRFPGGKVGWVRNDMLEAIKATQVVAAAPQRNQRSSAAPAAAPSRPVASKGPVSITSLLDTAYGYMGIRYTWGGTTSRGGFDCSGFVSTVYRQHGVSLPRTSIAMSGVGQAVSKGELKQGDLLFFKTQRGDRINHVGIYIGDNKFIHSSSSGRKVQIDSLSGYYSRRFAGARRVNGNLKPSANVKPQKHIEEQDDPEPVADEASIAPRKTTESRVTLGTDEITK